VPTRIIVDDGLTDNAKRQRVVEIVGDALRGRSDADELIAVVTRLPSGRLTVFVNHVADPNFVATIETALARLA
jgi:hypothetical protein